jgi:hypothetical protein
MQDDDDAVVVDPELEMEDREEEDDEETTEADRTIEEQQRELIEGIQHIIEPLIEANPEHRPSIESTAEGILGLIEGNGRDEGYILVKRTDADMAVVPCTRAVYEEHLRDFVTPEGLDISVGLLSIFDDVNS